ncbi:MAG: hypothetical protein CNLJKLNK_00648 [Holosporales bacterium]
MGKIYTIPLSLPYLSTLSLGLIERFDETTRPYVTVLMPSERATFSLTSIFKKQFGSHTLPKIQTLSAFCGLDMPTLSNLERSHFVIESLKKCFHHLKLDQLQSMAQEITQQWDEITLSGKTYEDVLNLNYSTPEQEIFKIITQGYLHYQKAQSKIDEQQKNMMGLHHMPAISSPTLLTATTATVPAVRAFSKKLLDCDQGIIVLPGLEDPQKIYSPVHPLHTQSLWMQDIEYTQPFDIWATHSKPTLFLDTLFDDSATQAIHTHITDFDCTSPLEEATLVSLFVRHHLNKNQTVAIVCNDHKLSHMIQNQLSTYNFLANQPLAQKLQLSVCGKFFLHYLAYLQKGDLKSGLSFLKHPLFLKGADRVKHLHALFDFEKNIVYEDKKTRVIFLNKFKDLPPFNVSDKHPPKVWITQAIDYLNRVSHQTAFQDTDGKALFDFLESIATLSFQKQTQKEWIQWIHAYMNFAPYVQAGENLHQNVILIGTLEARNITSDVVIVCNLNEDQWPSVQKPSLWLTQQSRNLLSLPKVERKIGLSAYDFATCLKADHVYLTRSVKVDGVQTHPNRWLQRIRFKTTSSNTTTKSFFEHILSRFTAPSVPVMMQENQLPSPLKKLEKLSISAIELLNKDPYAFYLRYILKLEEINPWYLGFSPAHLGQLVHKILEKIDFNKPFMMPTIDVMPAHRAVFIRHQIEQILCFVYENIDLSYDIVREEKISFTLRDGTLIYGIADRIDYKDGIPVRLIDYKTGTPPLFSSIKKGASLQMPLLAAMLTQNNYANESIEYWHLKGYKNQSKIIPLPLTQDIIDQAVSITQQLIEHFYGHGGCFSASYTCTGNAPF